MVIMLVCELDPELMHWHKNISIKFQSGRMRKNYLRKLAQGSITCLCSFLHFVQGTKQSDIQSPAGCAGRWLWRTVFAPDRGDAGDMGLLCHSNQGTVETFVGRTSFNQQIQQLRTRKLEAALIS